MFVPLLLEDGVVEDAGELLGAFVLLDWAQTADNETNTPNINV